MDCYQIPLPKHINPDSLALLLEHQATIEKEKPRIMLLSGTQQFCHGLDINWLVGQRFEYDESLLNGFIQFLDFIHQSPTISIAALRGSAIGGGVGIAAVCDVVLADPQSSFQLSEGLFGLTPGSIMPYLQTRLSRQQIKCMVLSAKTVTAVEACQLGLVDDIANDDVDLDALVQNWIKKLQRCHPQSVAHSKSILDVDNPSSPKEMAAHGALLLDQQLQNPLIQHLLTDYIDYGLVPWQAEH